MSRLKSDAIIGQDEPKRVQFKFAQTTIGILDRLQRDTGATSMTEVIKNALVLYNWAIKTVEDGGDLIVIDNHGGIREVVLPFHMENMYLNKEKYSSKKIKEMANKKVRAGTE